MRVAPSIMFFTSGLIADSLAVASSNSEISSSVSWKAMVRRLRETGGPLPLTTPMMWRSRVFQSVVSTTCSILKVAAKRRRPSEEKRT